jgi:exodeoxyribonuclease-3
MRIDFLLGSPALAGRVSGALIDREERKGKGASDHAPVVVELSEQVPGARGAGVASVAVRDAAGRTGS